MSSSLCASTLRRARGRMLFSVLILSSAPAFAQDQVESEKARHAKEHFELAERHYTVGQFADALDSYTSAYELVPAPGFLFNIGQCHRNLGHHERAIFFFQSYLREKPEALDRVRVEALIAQLKEKEVESAASEETAPPAPTALVVTEVEPPLYEKPWFWAVVGGGAAVVLGVILVASASGGGDGVPDASIGIIDARLVGAPHPYDAW